jgi:TM2 domain-containing membrane protein YozV
LFYKWDSPKANPFLFLSVFKFVFAIFICLSIQLRAEFYCNELCIMQNTVPEISNNIHHSNNTETARPHPVLKQFLDKLQRKRRITAAALAFPLPFGIIGLHRLYLGTQPYVPLVYIATVGGAFGILPFVDFSVILAKKDLQEFMNNKNVFMWVK